MGPQRGWGRPFGAPKTLFWPFGTPRPHSGVDFGPGPQTLEDGSGVPGSFFFVSQDFGVVQLGRSWQGLSFLRYLVLYG